jgi:hypothetical protein
LTSAAVAPPADAKKMQAMLERTSFLINAPCFIKVNVRVGS